MVGREEVMHAVRLARLDLAADELERIVRQVADILDHVEELAAVPVAGVPALGGNAEGDAPQRADDHDPDPLARLPSENAPAWAEGFFTVPRLAAMHGAGEAEA